MNSFSINEFATKQATTSSTPTQLVDVHYLQSSNQKGNQQPTHNRKMGRNNKKGGNKKENPNYDKNEKTIGGDKKTKRKVKFPYKLCGGYHLTYLCPRIEDALKLNIVTKQ